MGRAKEIQIRVIPSKIANPFIRAHHYSGKVVNNSCLHFGAFLDGRLHGVLSYGPSLDKKKIIGLVEGTAWDGFLELNRMAFDDYLPRNSESYCIAKTIRLIRKQAPQVKWIISFADGCSCGDGTIYRACNFVLTDIKRNDALCLLPNGDKIHKMTLHSNPTSPRPELGGRTFYEVTGGKYDWDAYVKEVGGTILPGYQLRYIYFIDPEYRQRLKVPEIPFSRIDELGAGMSETNYSSARQGMIEDDLTYTEEVELLQGKLMVEVYETFLISAVLAGKLTIPDFWNDPQKYMEHEWVASPKKWIDPQKEANANKTALESCVKSFKQISAEQGRDWKEQIDDMADVVAYAKEKGVQIGGYKSVQNEPQTDPKENPDE